MNNWYTTREGLWNMAWDQLQKGVTDRAAERFVTLSTISNGDQPESRLVVLRGADPKTATVQIHTDATSCKIKDLTENSKAALHHWSPDLNLQIRLRGTMTITTGETLRATWDALPRASFASYGVTPPPGTTIPDADAYDRTPKFSQFAVLTLTVTQADIVHLSSDFHRRAQFDRSSAFKGQWLAP